jgi:hypothetical protein
MSKEEKQYSLGKNKKQGESNQSSREKGSGQTVETQESKPIGIFISPFIENE